MHYGDYKDINDKIIHVLYAAYFDSDEMYVMVQKEYTKAYGEEAVKAIADFEVNYKPDIKLYR